LFGLRLSVVIASWQPAQYEARNPYLIPAGKEFAMNPQGDVGNSRKWLTALRSCCKMSSGKTGTLAAWCAVLLAFRWARPSLWNSFSKWWMKESFKTAQGNGFPTEVEEFQRRHCGNDKSRNKTNEGGADSQGWG
jgi:hypothetical protein